MNAFIRCLYDGSRLNCDSTAPRISVLTIIVFVWAILPLWGCRSAKPKSPAEYVDDVALTARVKAAISLDPVLQNSEIRVETHQGVVELTGFVDSRESAMRATDIIASMPDVASVKNDLLVRRRNAADP